MQDPAVLSYSLSMPDSEETVGRSTQEKKKGQDPEPVDNTDETWLITLSKAGGKKLGVDVDLFDGKCLLVDNVNPGMVDDWNKDHPDKAVQKEDLIVEVNGARGDAVALTELCKKDEVLRMVIWRPPEDEKQRWRETNPSG